MTGGTSRTANLPWGSIAILGLFLCLSVLYNISIPLYESPDELQHAAFVAWLADAHALPVVSAEEPGPWMQEGTQPPLYYWLAAVLLGRVPHDQADRLANLNPYANIGEPLRPDNKNRVLHNLEQESWPYQTGILFVHLARLLSTVLAMGTLWAIYRLGQLAFPERPGIALGMMGLVAFTPQFLFLSTSVNNDNMVILIASWVLVLLAGWLGGTRLPGWPQIAALGVLLGLAALAKLSGLLLWPLALGILVWLARRAHNVRWLILAGLLTFGLALGLCGWWYVRNLQLYGDLTGISAHIEVMGGHHRRLPSRLATILAEFRGFRYSFWALFGWFNILAPDAFYWLMDGLTVLGLGGFGVFLIRSLRSYSRSTRDIIWMLSAWFCLVAAGLLRWTTLVLASQGRLIYPALAAIALVLVVGWAELTPRRLRRPLGIAALAVWAGCAALVAALVLRPAYALPERLQSLDELDFVPETLNVRYGGCCELVGYVALDQPIYPGDWVPLTLVWRVLEPVDRDLTFYVHVRTADGLLAGQLDTYHGNGMYPTSQWQPGEIIVDSVQVPISWKAKGPVLVRFNVGLAEPVTGERLPVFAPDGAELEAAFAGEAALEPLQWPQPQPDSPIVAVFEERIRLAGIELPEAEVYAGDVLTVTVQWEALSDVTEDYTGFIHLVDPAGNDVSQDDHLPLNGRYPTRLWATGTVISDPYRLELPSDLEEGTYGLWTGLYESDSGQKLQAISPQTGLRWKDDLVYLGSLTVIGGTP